MYLKIIKNFQEKKSDKKKVIVIFWPTGAGKTQMSIEIAKFLETEIISTDSKQVYKYMDIWTGKITPEEMQWVKHHMIDIKNPDENFSVWDFKEQSEPLIWKLHSENKIPLLVGWTGLYIDSLIYERDLPKVEADYELRAQMESLSNDEMYRILQEIDPEYAAELHPNNRVYIERAIEVKKLTWKSKSSFRQQKKLKYEVLFLTPNGPFNELQISADQLKSFEYREWLYERINKRVLQMFEEWLEKEIKNILNMWYSYWNPGLISIGYQEFEGYSKWEIDLWEVQKLIQQHSRNYAKRQLTWFQKYLKNIAE